MKPQRLSKILLSWFGCHQEFLLDEPGWRRTLWALE